MMKDSALTLKKRFEGGEEISDKQAKKILQKSALVKKLLVDPSQRLDKFVGVHAYEWR